MDRGEGTCWETIKRLPFVNGSRELGFKKLHPAFSGWWNTWDESGEGYAVDGFYRGKRGVAVGLMGGGGGVVRILGSNSFLPAPSGCLKKSQNG